MYRRLLLSLSFLALCLAVFVLAESQTQAAIPVVDVSAEHNWLSQLARMQKQINVAQNTYDYVRQQMYYLQTLRPQSFLFTGRPHIIGRCDRSTIWNPVLAAGRQVQRAYFNLTRLVRPDFCVSDWAEVLQQHRSTVDLYDSVTIDALNISGIATADAFEMNKHLKEFWPLVYDTSEEGRSITASMQKTAYATSLMATSLRNIAQMEAAQTRIMSIEAMEKKETLVYILLIEESRRAHFDTAAAPWTRLE